MLQIFIKPSAITQEKWQLAYDRIIDIVENFPTKIIRLEAYNGFSPELDKIHFDLYIDKGTPNEHICFWGDWMSFTGSISVRFYKEWTKQLEQESVGKEIEEQKAVSWFPVTTYKNDGSVLQSNGIQPFQYHYIRTEGTSYKYALMAIGIMLENLFPGKVLFTALDQQDQNDISAVIHWLEQHFNQLFKASLYLDKPRLLASFSREYKTKKELVCRMEHLYRQKYLQNMAFAIEYIDYQAALEFYAEVLSNNYFGTFGFSDVLMPWMAATKDLEATLDLISYAEKHLLGDQENETNVKKASKYDLTEVLKDLLNKFVLWTPQQRERFDYFYTNKEALEKGEEDLFGTIRRMMGYRIDICPVYATKDELFKAFMYHEPKNGVVFKKIIDDWLEKNAESYNLFKQKLEEKEKELNVEKIQRTAEKATETKNDLLDEIEVFIQQYPNHEQFFIQKAIQLNPGFLQKKQLIKGMKKRVQEIIEGDKHQKYVQKARTFTNDNHRSHIIYRIKKIGYAVNPHFEQWLEGEQDENILFHLHFLMSLKLTVREAHYARFLILWNKNNWTFVAIK